MHGDPLLRVLALGQLHRRTEVPRSLLSALPPRLITHKSLLRILLQLPLLGALGRLLGLERWVLVCRDEA